jgi:hypothetical protein
MLGKNGCELDEAYACHMTMVGKILITARGIWHWMATWIRLLPHSRVTTLMADI